MKKNKTQSIEDRYLKIPDRILPPLFIAVISIITFSAENRILVLILCLSFLCYNILISKITDKTHYKKSDLLNTIRYFGTSLIAFFIVLFAGVDSPSWMVALPMVFGAPYTLQVQWKAYVVNVITIASVCVSMIIIEKASSEIIMAFMTLGFISITSIFSTLILKKEIKEHEKAEGQLNAINRQLKASEQQQKAINQQLEASEQQQKIINHSLQERMKELNCLYSVSNLVEGEKPLDEIYQSTVELLPPSWQYPEITCGKIVIYGKIYCTQNYKETEWKQTADIIVSGKNAGVIEAAYLAEKPKIDEGPFLKEERVLINGLAEKLGALIENKEAEKRLHESEKNFRNMFESSSEGLHLINSETGKFLEVNQAMCEMFGYTREEMLNISPEALSSPEDSEKQLKALEILMAGGKIENHEGKRIRKDKSKINVLISAQSLIWKGDKVIYGSIRNISQIKEYQEQILKKNNEILEFTNIVTHDLKKPLTTIKTVHSILGNNDICPLNKDSQETLLMGIEAVDYMQEMLEDLLACARLEAGTQNMILEEVEIKDVVETVIQRLKLQAEEKKTSIIQNYNVGKVKGDKKALIKVFMNLIGNAINYIGDKPHPEIIVSSSNSKNGEAIFSIKDNGIGIPEIIQNEIFTKFKRGSNVSGISGTGLGLSIVKGVIEAHGGKIWLESEEGKGTTFNFTLKSK